MSLPTISVVIPTYRRLDHLSITVPRLLEQEGLTELIVVVDGPGDDSLAVLQEWATADSRLRPLMLPEHGERMRALAYGVEASRSEVVLLMDDDVVPDPGLVAGHARHHSEGQGEGQDALVVIGYMPTEPPAAHDRHGFTTLLYAQAYEGACRRYETYPAGILEHLWGGNVSLRREACLRVGVVSPGFERMYNSDQDFGLRCAAAGLTGVFDRSLRATHRHRRPLDAFLRDAYSQGRGRALLSIRHNERIGPYNLDDLSANLPAAARFLVRQARRPWFGALLDRVLRPIGTFGPLRAQLATGKLLRRVHQQRGSLAIMEECASPWSSTTTTTSNT